MEAHDGEVCHLQNILSLMSAKQWRVRHDAPQSIESSCCMSFILRYFSFFTIGLSLLEWMIWPGISLLTFRTCIGAKGR